jgi:biotin operon repressor
VKGATPRIPRCHPFFRFLKEQKSRTEKNAMQHDPNSIHPNPTADNSDATPFPESVDPSVLTNPGGRPPHQPTSSDRGQVSYMASMGIPQAQIARKLRISRGTLRKHYRDELRDAGIDQNFAVAKTLYELATIDKNVFAVIFWLRTRAGFKVDGPTQGSPCPSAPNLLPKPSSSPKTIELSPDLPQPLSPGTISFTDMEGNPA